MTSASGAPTPNREAHITFLRRVLLPTVTRQRKTKSACQYESKKRFEFDSAHQRIPKNKALRAIYSTGSRVRSYQRKKRPSGSVRSPTPRLSSRGEDGGGRAGGAGGGAHRKWRRMGEPGGGGSPSASFDWGSQVGDRGFGCGPLYSASCSLQDALSPADWYNLSRVIRIRPPRWRTATDRLTAVRSCSCFQQPG
jgi:hypothetical protein